MINTEEKLDKSMDLLKRASEHLGDSAAPDDTWFRDLFLLTGEHMILTEEGWEPGESKKSYLDSFSEGEYLSNPILDEVNTPS